MQTLNRRAMTVPNDLLIDEINKANESKREILAERDKRYGADRPRIGSYLENIALPGLFGFDMNDYYNDSSLAMETELRHQLFWIDNSLDDNLAGLWFGAGTMYYDMTLFGLNIKYSFDGVPTFGKHGMERDFNMGLLKPFDFYETGEMPLVHKRYQELKSISKERYGEAVYVGFPYFNRGPLDIAIQLMGYDGFVAACAEAPDRIHTLMGYIVAERLRYNKQTAEFLGEPLANRSNYVADDWINVPFISPALLDGFIAPAYERIQKNEGTVKGFHTCGVYGPLLERLLAVFPQMNALELTGWNDFLAVDAQVDERMPFHINFINTFVMYAEDRERDRTLANLREIMKRRSISLCAGAIVKVHDSIDDSVIRMNRFIERARMILT